MVDILSMAGLASGVDRLGLAMAWCGLVCGAIAAIGGLVMRSRGATIVAIFFAAGVTILFMPWHALIPIDPAALEDWEVVRSRANWQGVFVGWIVALALTIGAAVLTFRSAKQSPPPSHLP